jgi:hypothetical protein
VWRSSSCMLYIDGIIHREKKRLKNESEGVVPIVVNAQSEKAALIARQQQSSSEAVAQCTCDQTNPQHARCDACKAEMEKEMEKHGEAPPAYYEVASGSNATTAVARA